MAGANARVLPGSRGLPWTDSSLPRATVALFVLAGLVLLAMCSNLAGLLLSRGLSRQMEYAVRMALGATRVDVLRHALAEVFVLSVFGGAGAILLTGWLTRLCSEVLTRGSLGLDYGVRVDGRVLAFALAAALATAVATQLMAALRFSSVDVGDALRSGRLTTSARLVGRKALLSVQVAAAMVLVSGSVLFTRTLQQLARVDGGFRAEGVLVVGLTGKIPRSEAGPEFFRVAEKGASDPIGHGSRTCQSCSYGVELRHGGPDRRIARRQQLRGQERQRMRVAGFLRRFEDPCGGRA